MIFEAKVVNASQHVARPYGSAEQLVYDAGDIPVGVVRTGDKVILATENGKTFLVSRPYSSPATDEGGITSAAIADAAITREKILAEAVSTVQIAQYAVTRELIAIDAIDGTKIADDAIESNHIRAKSISGYHIVANSIDASRIATFSLVADNIAAQAITTRTLSAEAVTADKIRAGTITADQIAAGTLTADSGVFGDLSADLITSGELDASLIKGDVIFSGEINADQITTGDLDAERINGGTARAFDGSNITNLNASNIQTGTLSADYIDGGQIVGDLIKGGTIIGTTIDAGTITVGDLVADRINGGTARPFNGSNITNLNATNITAGEINASLITAGVLDAGRIQSGTMRAERISGGTITGVTIQGVTVTGGTVQTAATGQRVVLHPDGYIEFRNAAGNFCDLKAFPSDQSIYTSYKFRADAQPSYFLGIRGSLPSYNTLPTYTWNHDYTTGIYSPAAGNLGFSVNGSAVLFADTGGISVETRLYAPGMQVSAAGGGTVLRYATSGNELFESTSSGQFKQNMRPAFAGGPQDISEAEGLLNARLKIFDPLQGDRRHPVSARRPADPGSRRSEDRGITWDRLGPVAEEWDTDYPLAVVYDPDGKPQAIDIQVVAYGMLMLIQDHERRLNILEPGPPT